MSFLHLGRLMGSYDQEKYLRISPNDCSPPSVHRPTGRLPPRRRSSRPLDMDIPPYAQRLLPATGFPHATKRNAPVLRSVLKAVSVLDMCRELPRMDEKSWE